MVARTVDKFGARIERVPVFSFMAPELPLMRKLLNKFASCTMPGKIIRFDDLASLSTLEQLAKDKAGTFQELADEAFCDLLKKYNRPTTLLGALKESVKHPVLWPSTNQKATTPEKAPCESAPSLKAKLQGNAA
jgi:hypothetical protein